MKKKLWLSAAVLAGLPALAQAQWAFTNIYNITSYQYVEAGYGTYTTAGADGNVYVVMAHNADVDGQLIKLALTWAGATVTSTSSVLHDFSDSTYGINPSAPVVEDANGNFFGTSLYGAGSSTFGTVWEYSASGTMSLIYQFSGGSTNACAPNDMTLVQGTADTVTLYGEAYGCTGTIDNVGAIFKLKGLPGTPASWHLTILHEFIGGSEGDEPQGGLTLGSDGNLYGTTHGAGASSDGTIFSITTGGTLTTIASFPSTAGTTGRGLVERDAGDTITFVGQRIGSGNNGVIYKVVKAGSGSWTYSTVHSFTGGRTDGANPQTNLIYSSGLDYFFGTTSAGGRDSTSAGTFYSLTPSGTFSILNSNINVPYYTLTWMEGSGCNPCAAGYSHAGGIDNDGFVWVAVAP